MDVDEPAQDESLPKSASSSSNASQSPKSSSKPDESIKNSPVSEITPTVTSQREKRIIKPSASLQASIETATSLHNLKSSPLSTTPPSKSLSKSPGSQQSKSVAKKTQPISTSTSFQTSQSDQEVIDLMDTDNPQSDGSLPSSSKPVSSTSGIVLPSASPPGVIVPKTISQTQSRLSRSPIIPAKQTGSKGMSNSTSNFSSPAKQNLGASTTSILSSPSSSSASPSMYYKNQSPRASATTANQQIYQRNSNSPYSSQTNSNMNNNNNAHHQIYGQNMQGQSNGRQSQLSSYSLYQTSSSPNQPKSPHQPAQQYANISAYLSSGVYGPIITGSPASQFSSKSSRLLSYADSNYFYGPKVLIIDNGAYSSKIGFSTDTSCDVIHNSTGKPKAGKKKYFGAELGGLFGCYYEYCKNHSDVYNMTISGSSSTSKSKKNQTMISGSSNGLSHPHHMDTNTNQAYSDGQPPILGDCNDFRSLVMHRPHDRGFVLNWELQSQIWNLEGVFKRKYPTQVDQIIAANQAKQKSNQNKDQSYKLSSIASDHCLILTDAPFSPFGLRQKMNEHVYDEIGFGGLFSPCPAYLTHLHHKYVENYQNQRKGTILVDDQLNNQSNNLTNTSQLGSNNLSGSNTLKLETNNSFNDSFNDNSRSFILSSNPSNSSCSLIVDIGYSFTHVVPFYDDYKINQSIRRLNIGGKIMTNYLRELVSYRHFNMMDQTFLVNVIKEKLCYVSQDYEKDMKTCRIRNRSNEIRRHYVLPDQTNSLLGYTLPTTAQRPPEDSQILTLNNERIAVPEVLFHPSDLGIRQGGLAEVILESVESCPEYLRPSLLSNIVLSGGCSNIPGLTTRLMKELRLLVPEEYPIRIYAPEEPGLTAWSGARWLANTRPDLLNQIAVTKTEYQEYGHNITKHKFSLF